MYPCTYYEKETLRPETLTMHLLAQCRPVELANCKKCLHLFATARAQGTGTCASQVSAGLADGLRSAALLLSSLLLP